MRTALTLSDLDYRFLATTPLFAGIAEQDIQAKLVALGAVIRSCPKGAFIHLEGDRVHTMSLVLRGRVHIEHDDVWGNRALLGQAETGDLFAEAYAAMGDEPLLIHVVAAEDTDVLCLDVSRILTIPAGQHWEYPRLTANLLHILARKNLSLSRRMLHTAPKTIRGRVLSYLSFLATKTQSRRFTIPFDRQQMADYLGVDRSALSAELSKMQKEGLLRYRKSDFFLTGAKLLDE